MEPRDWCWYNACGCHVITWDDRWDQHCCPDSDPLCHHRGPLCCPFAVPSPSSTVPRPWQPLICSPSLKPYHLAILSKWNRLACDLLRSTFVGHRNAFETHQAGACTDGVLLFLRRSPWNGGITLFHLTMYVARYTYMDMYVCTYMYTKNTSFLSYRIGQKCQKSVISGENRVFQRVEDRSSPSWSGFGAVYE